MTNFFIQKKCKRCNQITSRLHRQIQNKFFYNIMPYSFVDTKQCFTGTWCLHLLLKQWMHQGYSKTLVPTYHTTLHHIQQPTTISHHHNNLKPCRAQINASHHFKKQTFRNVTSGDSSNCQDILSILH